MAQSEQPSMEIEIEDDDFNEEDFIPCSSCDGHPACADFGCAYECGLGHMVETPDWLKW